MSTTADFDLQQFAAHVARLQHEHATRSEKEAAMRSAAAIRSWGCKVPPAFDMAIRDQIVAEHRTAWLRDAECVIRTLDHRAFADGTFHVIDGRVIGMPTTGYMGLSIAAHMHIIARDYLPRMAHNPVAAVAVLPEAVARNTCGMVCHARDAAIGQMRAAVAAVAAHELAHHVVAVVEGDPLPAGACIDATIAGLRSRGIDKGHSAAKHGPRWLRAYAHLVRRAAFVPHHAEWVARFRADVAAVQPHGPTGDAILDALHTDFLRFTNDDLLADVIRTPAPESFSRLFHHTPAAVTAGQE